jgi:hypothetical protein
MNAIDRSTTTRIACTFAAAALSLVSAACSSVHAEPPRAPAAPVGAAPCHPTGPAEVLVRKVSVQAATEAVAATRGHADDETMLAWESHDEPEPHITLGVVTYDAPHAFFGVAVEGKKRVVERTFFPPGAAREGGERAPALAAIGHDRFLLAWVDGDVESHQLRAQSVVGWGDPLGAPMVLSPSDASVIGRPSVEVGPDGYGRVTYVASVDGEFDLLATPIACAMN